MDTVKDEAASIFEIIVQTRIWNARHGGVFVEKKEGVESNEYLRQVGIEPDVKCEGGRIFTMRNPALMTKELSGLAREKSGVTFHITSLNPINPRNKPDDFEKKALEQFELGRREMIKVDRSGPEPLFRYMAPLFVEESCLPCHKSQGYETGDIRGGISVNVPVSGLLRKMVMNRLVIAGLSILTIAFLLGILYSMVWKLVVKLNDSQNRLKQMSITDELTGLRNRRHIMQRLDEEFQRARRMDKSLGIIMLDIDHFKRINDEFGHRFGDVVLKTIAKRVPAMLREYDLLGRIGGEEFLIVSPDTDVDETAIIAQRIRRIIGEQGVPHEGREVKITVSAGITMLKEEDRGVDALLSRVDKALYKAKQEGRDRVAIL
jgi:diguanylate cyclase (GGDEF)-like protein